MNWLVYHIASGHAFFTGVVLVITAALASTQPSRIVTRTSGIAFLVGIIAIAVSSTAIPYWIYAVALVATAAWVVSRYVVRWKRWATTAVVISWLIATAFEIQYHAMPSLQPTLPHSITVIGDSVTAGMGAIDTADRWPLILARHHDLVVQDISQMGETTGSAIRRVKAYEIESTIVVVEIGGNDLLGSTTSAQFESDLDALLSHLRLPGRQLVMFELPLPPFCIEYGRIQRSLARKHSVSLVPKRVFLSVLSAGDSTIDTIHLTQAGHDRMAACVWSLIRSAFP